MRNKTRVLATLRSETSRISNQHIALLLLLDMDNFRYLTDAVIVTLTIPCKTVIDCDHFDNGNRGEGGNIVLIFTIVSRL